jgi:hypothetical protein
MNSHSRQGQALRRKSPFDAASRHAVRAGSAGFVYDGDGRRVKATVNGVTTCYVGDDYEVSGGVVRNTTAPEAGAHRDAQRRDAPFTFLIQNAA